MALPDIPGYNIVRELGAGGMARVYLAVQESLHREVALKVMIPGLSVDEISCHRFLKEGRIAAQLNHQNLLTVYDIGVHEDQYYMASEYLPGGTARDRMKNGLSPDDAVKIISEVAQGLQYAHSKGFVHRDVKPGNLLFRANGECVLGDFGIAKSVDSTTNATQLGTSIGTPHYMSPEQAKGEKVDHRTDLYSLGVVFYELLVGKPPFDADDPFTVALAQINEPVPPMEGEVARFRPIIERLMAKQREDRFESAEAFLDELEELTGHVGPMRRTTRKKLPAVSGDQAGAPFWRGPVARSLGVVVLVAMVAYGGWAVYRGVTTQPAPREASEGDGTVAGLLAQASEAIDQGRFFVPEGQAAIDRLEEALRLDPANVEARRRLDGLVAEAAAMAEELWDEGATDEAKRIISEGLRRYPSNAQLRDLLARADTGTVEQTPVPTVAPGLSDAALEATLDRAARFFRIGDFGEAASLYRQVLNADPDNADAASQLQAIADTLASYAEDFLRQGEIDQAEAIVDRGLQAQPGHQTLVALQERIAALRNEEG